MKKNLIPPPILLCGFLVLAMGNSALLAKDSKMNTDNSAVTNSEIEKAESLKTPTSPPEFIKELWLNLEQTSNQCPEKFDYFPNGGMQIFYCHLKTFLSYEQLQALVKMPIFLEGPHTKTELKLDAQQRFGHYNPAFVKWLTENVSRVAQEPTLQKQTQTLYEQYVKPLARTYYVAHERLVAQPDTLTELQTNYFKLLKNQQLPPYYYEQFYDFADLHKQAFDGNVVKTGLAFWLRRFIDGTEAAFFAGLKTLLMTYDADFITATQVLGAKIHLDTQVWTYKRTIKPQYPKITFQFIGRQHNEGQAEIMAMQFKQGNETEPFQILHDVNQPFVMQGNQLDFRLKDINLDSYQDIRLMISSYRYFCWLFEPTKKVFVKLLLECGW